MGYIYIEGFPHSSVGKESSCNAGDPGSIPGLGRSAGEEIGYPLPYSWAPLVAQLVKNLRVLRETWIRSLEKGKATHSSILAWRIHGLYRLLLHTFLFLLFLKNRTWKSSLESGTHVRVEARAKSGILPPFPFFFLFFLMRSGQERSDVQTPRCV